MNFDENIGAINNESSCVFYILRKEKNHGTI